MKALIFDVDGTLAETEEWHRHAFNRAFADAELDWHWSVETYTRLLKTTGGKERMRLWRDLCVQDISDEMISDLHRIKTAHYSRFLAQGRVTLRPGISDLISYGRANGLRLAVATTTNRLNVEALCLSCFGHPAEEVFEVIAAGDEVPMKKPAPDVYLLAMALLGLEPSDALAFEDSQNGVLSAKSAGLRVIASPSLYSRSDCLDGADEVVSSITTDLLKKYHTQYSSG